MVAGRQLHFGSELKVLTAHPGFVRDIDPLAVEGYFSFGYVPDPRCIYQNAHKLPAAHTLTLRRGDAGRPAPRPYWDVRFTNDNPIKLQDAQAELRERVRESVRLRMIADVPLGAFLSGGGFQCRGGHHGGPVQRAGAHLLHRV